MSVCAISNCLKTAVPNSLFCAECFTKTLKAKSEPIGATAIFMNTDIVRSNVQTNIGGTEEPNRRNQDPSMATRYPKYYKTIPAGVVELDIYAVCHMFQVNDAALSHALKKIILPGTRTGGKSRRDDIKEARDTLTRWLELHK